MYDPIPFFTGYLPEQDGHQIYYEQYGNVKGPAIVVLHGGPGSKSKPRHIKPFDLTRYHVITFHQRGCGKSLPFGSLENNTTPDLLNDIERLRDHLKITEWFVSGGSWGSTLALIYAEAYPNNIRGLLLNSIALARQPDIDWSMAKPGGVDRIFPDLLAIRAKFFSQFNIHSNNIAGELLQLINQSKPEQINEIVSHILAWEGNLLTSQSDLTFTTPADINEELIAMVKVNLHYESHKFFLTENEILNNIAKIATIPTIIVHGRHDMLCPADQAWILSQKLQNSELIILPTSNHYLSTDGRIAQQYAYRYFLAKQESTN